MTAGRLAGLKKAIVGLLMSVDVVEGSFKLNQHKSDVDHAAIAAALARQPEAAAQALASEMRALRPHLVASGTTPSNDTALPEGTTR
jgi:transcriptional regulator